MALNAQQQQFAKDIATLVGIVLKEVPDQNDVQAYVALINQEIGIVASAPNAPTTQQVGQAALAVVSDIIDLVPDTTPGEKKFHNFAKIALGFSKLFGF